MAAVALAALVVGLIAPAAIAQQDENGNWSGSKFTAPGGSVVTSSSFPVQGVFVATEGGDIRGVSLEFGRGDDDLDGAGSDDCVPDDRGDLGDSQVTYQNGSRVAPDGGRAEFSVGGVQWPCNGRFAVRARADRLVSPDHSMVKSIRVAVPAPPVTDTVAETTGNADPATGATEDDPETVTVRWIPPLGQDEPRGYRIERAKGEGDFATVGAVDDQAFNSFEDTVTSSGNYEYRVRALRDSGVSDPATVASPVEGTAVAKVHVTGPADDEDGTGSEGGASGDPSSTLTTPESTAPLDIPDSAGNQDSTNQTPRLDLPSPPTTLDTGFDESLDYGEDGRRSTTTGGDELAGEGQSVIRTDDEDDAGLAGPVAGALVLIGWAGHVAYLNRLAKQF